MTSESQERMLAIVAPEALGRVEEVCQRWEVRSAVVGRVTPTGRLRILDGWDGPVLADVPASTLHDEAPVYERPMAAPAPVVADDPRRLPPPADAGEDLLALLRDPSWVYRQYDHQLFLNTVVGPGGDAALLRLAGPGVEGSGRKAIALSTDGSSRWCAIDPRRGTALTVAESALNVACVGATPVALVNCLNFGNPEHPEVMWQLSEAVDGMAEACRALSIPVVGGNVSLYNESRGRDIDPTPVVGTLGLVADLRRRPAGVALADGHSIVLVGAPVEPCLAGSRWAVDLRGRRGGTLPEVDFDAHSRLLRLVADLVGGDTLPSLGGTHDVSDGGLAVALAEMAVSSQVGFTVAAPAGDPSAGDSVAEALFGEGPSRVLFSVEGSGVEALRARVTEAGLVSTVLGRAGGDRLVVVGALDVSLADATAAWKGSLPAALALTRA